MRIHTVQSSAGEDAVGGNAPLKRFCLCILSFYILPSPADALIQNYTECGGREKKQKKDSRLSNMTSSQRRRAAGCEHAQSFDYIPVNMSGRWQTREPGTHTVCSDHMQPSTFCHHQDREGRWTKRLMGELSPIFTMTVVSERSGGCRLEEQSHCSQVGFCTFQPPCMWREGDIFRGERISAHT